MNTYKKGYLKADISNFFIRLIFNRSKFVWHKKGIHFNDDIYYLEEDKFHYLDLMKEVFNKLNKNIHSFKFNEFVGKCETKINTTNCIFQDTLTNKFGNIIFDKNLNIIKYSDDDIVISKIK